jgi:hypothetical protein
MSESMDALRALMVPEPRLLFCLPDGWEAVNLVKPELFYKVRGLRGRLVVFPMNRISL